MDELLQRLLEAEVLSEETKNELESAFSTQLNEAIDAAKKEAAADMRTELTEQWIKERDTLVEAVDSKIGDYLDSEMVELKEDVERFRDLEAEYAEKIVIHKSEMASELKEDLKELVEKVDAFLEIRLNSEMRELKEDIEEVRKNDFGRKIFEAFYDEFNNSHSNDKSIKKSLQESKRRLADTEKVLLEYEEKLAKIEHKTKLEEVLSPLSGHAREVMEAILRNVDTENLEEGYKTFIGRVLRETEDDLNNGKNNKISEKEDKVLAGGKKIVKEGVFVSGNTEKTHNTNSSKLAESYKIQLQKLGGIVK
jgi:hypothetical protein